MFTELISGKEGHFHIDFHIVRQIVVTKGIKVQNSLRHFCISFTCKDHGVATRRCPLLLAVLLKQCFYRPVKK